MKPSVIWTKGPLPSKDLAWPEHSAPGLLLRLALVTLVLASAPRLLALRRRLTVLGGSARIARWTLLSLRRARLTLLRPWRRRVHQRCGAAASALCGLAAVPRLLSQVTAALTPVLTGKPIPAITGFALPRRW